MSNDNNEDKPNKKAGRPSNKIKDAAFKRQLGLVQERIQKNKEKLKKLKRVEKLASGEITVVAPEELDDLSDLETRVVEEQTKTIWKPHPGPQEEFLKSNEDEVLFAGGRGSGKSDCLIIDPLRYCENKNFRGLLIRRTMPELRELISRAKDLYPQAYPGCKWREQEKMFAFPSGARIEFGYCDHEDDLERYKGQQYTWLGIDEITQFPSADIIDKLKGSLRSPDKTLPIHVRATTNPNGAGRGWVKERFVDLAPSGQRIIIKVQTPLGEMQTTRKWFNSKLSDNPTLTEANPQYMAFLASLPEILRRQWLDGDWLAAEGLAFSEFKEDDHIVAPFEIPSNWMKFRACDWGFTTMAVCLWIAVDYDNNYWVYRELKTGGGKVYADTFAQTVLALESKEKVRYGVIDGSVADERGSTGPSIEEQMRNEGCHWRHADKSKGSRVAGKMVIHKLLRKDPITGKPRLRIFNNCRQLIKELGTLQLDDHNPEDVDTDMEDHAYDALRYGVNSRPEFNKVSDIWNTRENRPQEIVDSTFGY